ncbi:MAG TPA: Flp family type IVb pilin [Streptosporangiaceae bacterium]
MLTFYAFLRNHLTRPAQGDDRGVTAVEYALLGIFIAVVIVGAVTLLGTTLNSMYQAVVSAL